MEPAPYFEISTGREVSAALFMGCLLLGSLVYVIRRARRDREMFPIFLFLGAGLGVFLEPFVDVLGHCDFPDNTVTLIDMLGVNIPVYIGMCYFFYFCVPVLALMKRIRQGMTHRDWLIAYSGAVTFCLLFEPGIIALDWETYYGDNQTWKFFGLPFWWGFLNAHCMFVSAAWYVTLRRRVIEDRHSFLFIAIVPITLLATYGAAMPVFTALNSTDSQAVTNLAGLLAVAVAIMNVWIVGRLVTNDHPAAVASVASATAPTVKEAR